MIRVLTWTVFGLFILGCIFELRADAERTSLSQIWRARGVLPIAIGLSLLNYALRILRWRCYLLRLGHSVQAWFVVLTYLAGFAFTLSPGKLGEVIRARYYTVRGIPLSHMTGMFIMERSMDLLAVCALAALLLLMVPQYTSVYVTTLWVTGGLVTLLAVLPWDRLVQNASDIAWIPGFLTRATTGIAATVRSARALLGFRLVMTGFLLGVAAWTAEGVGLGILSSVFPSPHLDPPLAVGIYSVAVLAGALSFLPGGLGSTEAVMTALLVTRGYALPDAAFITLACRIVTLWLAIGLGWIAVLALRGRTEWGAP